LKGIALIRKGKSSKQKKHHLPSRAGRRRFDQWLVYVEKSGLLASKEKKNAVKKLAFERKERATPRGVVAGQHETKLSRHESITKKMREKGKEASI